MQVQHQFCSEVIIAHVKKSSDAFFFQNKNRVGPFLKNEDDMYSYMLSSIFSHRVSCSSQCFQSLNWNILTVFLILAVVIIYVLEYFHMPYAYL